MVDGSQVMLEWGIHRLSFLSINHRWHPSIVVSVHSQHWGNLSTDHESMFTKYNSTCLLTWPLSSPTFSMWNALVHCQQSKRCKPLARKLGDEKWSQKASTWNLPRLTRCIMVSDQSMLLNLYTYAYNSAWSKYKSCNLVSKGSLSSFSLNFDLLAIVLMGNSVRKVSFPHASRKEKHFTRSKQRR